MGLGGVNLEGSFEKGQGGGRARPTVFSLPARAKAKGKTERQMLRLLSQTSLAESRAMLKDEGRRSWC